MSNADYAKERVGAMSLKSLVDRRSTTRLLVLPNF